MLFAVKNDWRLATGLAAIFFLIVWFGGVGVLDALNWAGLPNLPSLVVALVVSGAVLGLSDGALHFLLSWLFGKVYLERYGQLTQFFAPQGWREMVAGGVLAMAEEGVFRGMVLVFLLGEMGMGIPAGVALTSLLFGLCHLIPRRNLAPFALWSVWESLLLCLVFLWTDSLLITMLVHGLHDFVGFSLFALQRRTGWLLKR